MKTKKLLIVLLICLLSGAVIYAETQTDTITAKKIENCVFLTDTAVSFTDQNDENLPTLEYKDSIYVPVRSFCKHINRDVEWDEGCVIVSKPTENKYEGTMFGEIQGYEYVSLIDLIAYPEKYDGKNIKVCGIINYGFEANLLYLTKEDWTYGNISNAIEWGLSSIKFSSDTDLERLYKELEYMPGTFVEIEGKYIARQDDYVHGGLVDIKSIYCSKAI